MEDVISISVFVLIWVIAILRKQQKAKRRTSSTNVRTSHVQSSARGARPQRVQSAPLPAEATAAPEAPQARFTPWTPVSTPAPEPLPLQPGTGSSMFLSGQEGMRVTQDLVEDAGADIPGAGEPDGFAPLFTDGEDRAGELRRGIIWAEILTPRFKNPF